MGKLVGITGFAGTGKDTIANYLKECYTDQFRSIAFADPIRTAMKAIFGWDDSYFAHPKKNEIDPRYGISPRKAMQTLGTEWGRNLINTDLWLMIAGEKAKEYLTWGYDVLITDVRFENEANWVRTNGGVIWHVLRDGVQGAGTESKHASESGIVFVSGDIRIDNNYALEDLYERLDDLAVDLWNQESERTLKGFFNA